MSEYTFDLHAPPPRGRVTFRARNLGRLEHELVLVSLPEDLPPIDEQLRSDERRSASTIGRIAPRASGATGTFAVDLTSGRYAFVCFVVDPDGEQHARKGMSAEFRVP